MKLPSSFYERDVVLVARDLIGKKWVYGPHHAIITETEAYGGVNDAASHANKGLTKRNSPMFGPPGHAYVYFIYGMYYCFNIVAQAYGDPAAVLIRGLRLPDRVIKGPGRLCRYFGITHKENKMSLIDNDLYYLANGVEAVDVRATKRIGIQRNQEALWRFFAKDLWG